MTDPVIIDYPKNRDGLRRVFSSYASRPGFAKNIKIAKKALSIKGKNG